MFPSIQKKPGSIFFVRSQWVTRAALLTFVVFVSFRTTAAGQLTIVWDPPGQQEDVAGYNLYVAKEHQILSPIDVGPTNMYTFSNVDPGTRLLVFVTAYDSFGFESDDSVVLQYPAGDPCFAVSTLGAAPLSSARNSGTFRVITPVSCSGEVSSDASWLDVSASSVGAETKISYAARSNRDGDVRSGLIRFGSTAFTIVQRGGAPTPPIITRSLLDSASSNEGAVFELSVEVEPEDGLSYQWYKDGILLGDATSSIFTIADVQATDAASYSVDVSNDVGTTRAGPLKLVVNPKPRITLQPGSIVGSLGDAALFFVRADGTGLHYGWTRNGLPVGSDFRQLSINSIRQEDLGIYQVTVSNEAGSVQSQKFYLATAEFEQELGLIRITLLPDGTLRVQGKGVPGKAYIIQTSRDLIEWTYLDSFVVADVGLFTIESPKPIDDPPGHWFVRTLRPAL